MKKNFQNFRLLGLAVLMALAGCAPLWRAVGFASTPDIDARRGPGGTQDKPDILSPFVTYTLVMAGKESRYFRMRVPPKWYWKLYVTAANDQPGRDAQLSAAFDTSEDGWQPVAPFETHKDFAVSDGSCQAALATANAGPDRMLTLRISQQGAPVKVILESQVSAFGPALLEPPLKESYPDRPENP